MPLHADEVPLRTPMEFYNELNASQAVLTNRAKGCGDTLSQRELAKMRTALQAYRAKYGNYEVDTPRDILMKAWGAYLSGLSVLENIEKNLCPPVPAKVKPARPEPVTPKPGGEFTEVFPSQQAYLPISPATFPNIVVNNTSKILPWLLIALVAGFAITRITGNVKKKKK
jgi:hypothetical protein